MNNEKAIYLYEKCGFKEEGQLVQEIFMNGEYTDVKRMYILQNDYLKKKYGLIYFDRQPIYIVR